MGLYVRSRRLGRCAALLAGFAAVAVLWGERHLALPSLRGGGGLRVPVMLVLPVAFAIAIALSTRGSMPELERTAPRRLTPVRAAHAAGLAALATALLVAAGHGSPDALAGVRNVLGCAGLAYLGAVLVGGDLSWMLPLGYALAVPLVGLDAAHRPAFWAWLLDPASAGRSWLWAGALVVAGVAAFALRDARPGEAAELEPA